MYSIARLDDRRFSARPDDRVCQTGVNLPESIASRLERHSITGNQILLLAVMTVALVFDGLDVKLLSFAAPMILKEWHMSKAALGPALASALVGMALGAWAGGWLGDRWGRRAVILFSIVLFGVATVIAGATRGVITLTVLRFFGGIGFGSLTPNAFALVAEWLPQRSRSGSVALLSIGSPLGGMIGASLALVLLPHYSWHTCFVIMGVATLTLSVGMLMWLPESTRFLMIRQNRSAALRQWHKMMDEKLTEHDLAATGREPTEAAFGEEIHSIFRPVLSRLNYGAFLCFFSAYFVNYIFSSWLPVVLNSAGLDVNVAIRGSLFYNIMAVAGALLTGVLLRRVDTKRVLIGASTVQIAALAATAVLLRQVTAPNGSTDWTIMMAISVSGLASGIIATAVAAVVASGYPVAVRSTGIGFGMMAGRVGGIAASLVGGMLLSIRDNDPTILFTTLCVFTGVGILSTFIIDRHTGVVQNP